MLFGGWKRKCPLIFVGLIKKLSTGHGGQSPIENGNLAGHGGRSPIENWNLEGNGGQSATQNGNLIKKH